MEMTEEHNESIEPILHDDLPEDDDTLPVNPIVHHCTPVPALSLVVYLVLWVANCEKMQGVANGLLAPEPFDRPTFLSWTAYSALLLGWIPVILCCHYYWGCTVGDFLRKSWAGGSDLTYMLRWSCAMQYMLLSLNILWVIGLTHVSVAVSNAVYQLQAAATIGFSVAFLGTRFVFAEAFGIFLSFFGVALIVLPPMLDQSSPDNETPDDSDFTFGVVTTLVSAIIWGMYQVAWRIISKGKRDLKMTRLEGLMDTMATLGVMGLVNVVAGWPLLVAMHVTGLEPLTLPSWDLVPALTFNGIVEFAFDVSCAVAIFLTSPVMTAITAPLTIPISLIFDHFLYGSSLQVGPYDWIGSLIVLIGVIWTERKISMRCYTCDDPRNQLASTLSSENDYREMPERFV